MNSLDFNISIELNKIGKTLYELKKYKDAISYFKYNNNFKFILKYF